MTKTLDSTAVYAYTTLISAIVCLPFALIAEGPILQSGAAAAIAKVSWVAGSTSCFGRWAQTVLMVRNHKHARHAFTSMHELIWLNLCCITWPDDG